MKSIGSLMDKMCLLLVFEPNHRLSITRGVNRVTSWVITKATYHGLVTRTFAN